MDQPSRDPSIFQEPHLRKGAGKFSPQDPPLGLDKSAPLLSADSEEDVQFSVWDEPVLSADLAGEAGDGDLRYSSWLAERQSGWNQGKAWLVTIGVALLSGPWALLLVLLNGFDFNRSNVLMVCIFAPLTQEVCKNAIALWIVEKRPYYFTGWFQLFFCSLASATIFVTIWNGVDYLIAPPETRLELVLMWTVFLFMHVVTSTLAATGLEKIWRRAVFLREPPRLEHGSSWFMAAFLVHVCYSVVAYVVYLIFIYAG